MWGYDMKKVSVGIISIVLCTLNGITECVTHKSVVCDISTDTQKISSNTAKKSSRVSQFFTGQRVAMALACATALTVLSAGIRVGTRYAGSTFGRLASAVLGAGCSVVGAAAIIGAGTYIGGRFDSPGGFINIRIGALVGTLISFGTVLGGSIMLLL